MSNNKTDTLIKVISASGGFLTGRTRLQKTVYLLDIAGLVSQNLFSYEYHHYGPYSEELALTTKKAVIFGDIKEEKKATDWGGEYSIYTVDGSTKNSNNSKLQPLLSEFNKVTSVQLELLATAIFLSQEEGIANPWEETELLKPEKSLKSNIDSAKKLYEKIGSIANFPKVA